jgi:gamma-glutamylcyclotransferase (GGCT)/AIG2-like uncharacterized protein YtfP
VIDTGQTYGELRGVELIGSAEVVGEVPRSGETHVEALDGVERAFALKYTASIEKVHDGRHAWLKVKPEREFTWDFRKLATIQAGED